MTDKKDLKVCPFWVFLSKVAFNISIGYEGLPLPENEEEPVSLNYANCKGEGCQLWDAERGDCGLKHFATPAPLRKDPTPDLDNLPRPGISIPEKDWEDQKKRQKPLHRPVDAPPPESEPE